MKLEKHVFTKSLITFVLGTPDCHSGATSSELVGNRKQASQLAQQPSQFYLRSDGSYRKTLTPRGSTAHNKCSFCDKSELIVEASGSSAICASCAGKCYRALRGEASTGAISTTPSGLVGQCVFCSRSRDAVPAMAGNAQAHICRECLHNACALLVP